MSTFYFPPPRFIPSIKKYQNVNADPNLQNLVTQYFLDELNIWFKKTIFLKNKSLKKKYSEEEIYDIMHNIEVIC